MLASYGKMEAKDGNRPFCSIVPNSLGSRVVDGWSHKVCKQGDCGHVTPLSWQKPQHSPCSNKRALTPGSQGCFSSLPCGSNAEITTKEWGELRNFSKEVGHFWVGFFFFFFLIGFHLSDLSVVKLDVCKAKKILPPHPLPHLLPSHWPVSRLQCDIWANLFQHPLSAGVEEFVRRDIPRLWFLVDILCLICVWESFPLDAVENLLWSMP